MGKATLPIETRNEALEEFTLLVAKAMEIKEFRSFVKNEAMENLKISLISITLTVFFLSCEKEEINSTKEAFAIEDVGGEVVTSLPPDLLSSIHQDLIQKGRESDANTLYDLYDQETGYLKKATVADKTVKLTSLSKIKVDSSKMVVMEEDTIPLPSLKSWKQHYVYLYAHCQKWGDTGPYQQAPNDWNYYYRPYYAGTTKQSRRLEGMWLQTAQFLAPTRPDIKYQLVDPNGATSYPGTGTWGQFVGTRGQSKAVIGLQMWSDTPGFHIWYIAHNQTTGWNGGWYYDGQIAGTNKRLEAFAFYILKY